MALPHERAAHGQGRAARTSGPRHSSQADRSNWVANCGIVSSVPRYSAPPGTVGSGAGGGGGGGTGGGASVQTKASRWLVEAAVVASPTASRQVVGLARSSAWSKHQHPMASHRAWHSAAVAAGTVAAGW